mmetsp:Transcript_27346/g.77996  ORF Transcript_27346/g.77996 Transcript_27346/m.77996 type:complete len:1623 (-) Transcript_27346:183-5051(-)
MRVPLTAGALLVACVTARESISFVGECVRNGLDDGVPLIQTYARTAYAIAAASQPEEPFVRAAANRTVACAPYAGLGMAPTVGVDSVANVMSFYPPQAADSCSFNEHDSSVGPRPALLQVGQHVTETFHGVPPQAVVWAYLAGAFLVVAIMFHAVVGVQYDAPKGLAARYPEAEAWHRSKLDWLWMGWATPLIARWGCSENESLTKIHPADIPMSDPLDECDVCFKKFKGLWKEEVNRVGLANASLLKVVTRFVTYKKVFSIGLWNAVYEGFLFMGPPMAIKWVTKYMNWLFTQRALGEDVRAESLVGPTMVLIAIFTGMPMLMAVANSMCTMLNGRISIQIDGALTLAVYEKAQRLPVVQEDDAPVLFNEVRQLGNKYDAKLQSRRNKTGVLKEDREFDESRPDEWEKLAFTKGMPTRFNLVQVVSNDINTNLMAIPNCLARMCVMVPVLIGTLCLLIQEIGWAFIFSLIMALANLGLMTQIGYMMRNSLGAYFWCSGKRLQFIQEALSAIRFVKGCGAESVVTKRMEDYRKVELKSLDKFYTIQCFMFVLSQQFPKLYLLGSLAGYSLFHKGHMDPSLLMSLIPLLFSVQGAIGVVFSLVPSLVMALPSCRRLETFLKLPEAPKVPSLSHQTPKGAPALLDAAAPVEPSVEPGPATTYRLQGDFSWSEVGKASLQDMDIYVPTGALVAVVGPTGCGKTTFMHALLGELYARDDARMEVPARVAYSAQVPHIFEGSLRDNILKGDAYDYARYKEALHSACLLRDLEVLPGGDQTLVGGRGITISGGQKARISLARAAYDTGDLVLLDDPFAALDAHTYQHLCEKYLRGPLMEGRTRIISFQPDSERLQTFDWIVVLDKGRVAVQGPAKEVLKTEEYLSLLSTREFSNIGEEEECQTVTLGKMGSADQVRDLREEECEGRASWVMCAYFGRMGGWFSISACVFMYLVKDLMDLRCSIELSTWMNHASGYNAGTTRVYPSAWKYGMQYSFWMGASTLTWFVCWAAGQKWTLRCSAGCHRAMVRSLLHAPIDRFYDKTPTGRIMNRMANDMSNIDLQVFVACTAVAGMLWAILCPLYYVHLQMPLWFTILCVPFYYLVLTLLSLYWKTMVPLRYLMQVCKSGVSSGVADVEGTPASVRAYNMQEARQLAFGLMVRRMISADFLGRIVCIRWICNRLFILGGIFVTGLALMAVWIPGATDVGTASLVINAMFGIIVGVEGSLNTGSSAQYQLIAMNRVYEYTSLPEERESTLPTDSTFRSITACIQRAKLREMQSSKGRDGVVISASRGRCTEKEELLHQVPGEKCFVAASGRLLVDLAPSCKALRAADTWHRIVGINSKHNSAEEMADELCKGDSEQVILHIRSGWLVDGVKVEIKNLRIGYADVPHDVLHGISLTVARKEKAGIVGPTGCGKSTLLLSLLRMLEPRDGRIYLEGVDTQQLGLSTLRQSVGLVPQDPVLLQGTLRFNIDPFQWYDDDAIWEALELVHMADFVKYELKDGLNFQVNGEGLNLSFGQRQLISFARNVVRGPKLLLLDEATSAIDPKAQETLQATVEEAFKESTIIVIAHRLETILNFDLAVVMDRGRIAEKGSVRELAQVKGGRFAKMLAAKGLSVPDPVLPAPAV